MIRDRTAPFPVPRGRNLLPGLVPAIAAAWLALAPPTAAAPAAEPAPSGSPAPPDTAPAAAAAEQLDSSAADKEPPPVTRRREYDDEGRPVRVRHHPRHKSDIWLPLPSVLLPGFGQYLQGDWTGAIYTGVAVGGYLLFQAGAAELDTARDPGANLDPTEGQESWSIRKIVLGSMAYQGSGFLSAYSAFRSSVPRFQQEDGKYAFLTSEETLGDMMLSPARFDHLAQPSAFIPLGLLAAGAAYLTVDYRGSHRGSDWTFSADDLLFSWPLAYNAGVTEEALFRGWLLPVAYQYTGETWWLANGAQALLFGAAHYSSGNPFPWPQALLGYYFGYLTRKNGWTLSESIFVHSWWDAILFTAQYVTMRRAQAGATAFRFDLPLGF